LDGACSIHEKMHKKFYSEHKKGRDHLGHLSIDARIMLKCILMDMDEWRTPKNTAGNLEFHRPVFLNCKYFVNCNWVDTRWQ